MFASHHRHPFQASVEACICDAERRRAARRRVLDAGGSRDTARSTQSRDKDQDTDSEYEPEELYDSSPELSEDAALAEAAAKRQYGRDKKSREERKQAAWSVS